MVLTGNVAMESMGFKISDLEEVADVWEPEEDIYWGQEAEWLGDKRYTGVELENFGSSTNGLDICQSRGPNGNPDPLKSAIDIRETFGRMAMNDYETVALIVGGHTLETHGAADADQYVELNLLVPELSKCDGLEKIIMALEEHTITSGLKAHGQLLPQGGATIT